MDKSNNRYHLSLWLAACYQRSATAYDIDPDATIERSGTGGARIDWQYLLGGSGGHTGAAQWQANQWCRLCRIDGICEITLSRIEGISYPNFDTKLCSTVMHY